MYGSANVHEMDQRVDPNGNDLIGGVFAGLCLLSFHLGSTIIYGATTGAFIARAGNTR